MRRALLLGIYNLLFPLFALLGAPAWLVKMAKRGGLSRALWERVGRYDREAEFEKTGGIYLHAVSVGEAVMALKLINYWKTQDPEESFVLAATTSTGYDLARAQAGEGVRVIYSPLDVPWMLRRVWARFDPRLIVLVDSELWPNLLYQADRSGVPVALVNARLSPRSERRHRQLNGLTRPFLSLVKGLCAQAPEHAKVWKELGVAEEAVEVTGSLKFDPAGQAAPVQRPEFEECLRAFGAGRRVVLIASTHAGEEALLAGSYAGGTDELLVIVPRHAERRAEVRGGLEALGFEVVLRTKFSAPKDPARAVLVADTTGELRDWTAHADAVVVGKSFLGRGGQNPTEAIAAGKPVVTGPHMENFEPLVEQLREAGGMLTVQDAGALRAEVAGILDDGERRGMMVQVAAEILDGHQGATARTVEVLRRMLA
jgi:3-deoxy-D-manno-octulosonic-acid transferase